MVAILCVLYFSPLLMKDIGAQIVLGPARYPKGYYDKPGIDKIQPKDFYVVNEKGIKIHGWFFQKPNAKLTVIFHHGRGENLTYCKSWAKRFIDCDASVVLYDYSGFGKSGGNVSFESLTSDGESVYRYVVSDLHVKPGRLVNAGFSMGCAVATYVASRNECAGILLFAPYDSMTSLVKRKFPIWKFSPDWMFSYFNKFDVVKNLRNCKARTVVAYASGDKMMGNESTESFLKLDSEKVLCFPLDDVGHGDLLKADIRKYVRFLFNEITFYDLTPVRELKSPVLKMFLDLCFKRYKENFPVPIKKLKKVRVFIVPAGRCMSGEIGEGEFYIFLSNFPRNGRDPYYWGAIAHESMHLASPLMKDCCMEGICSLFAVDILKEYHLDSLEYKQLLKSYPFYAESYYLAQELRDAVGIESFNNLFLYLKPIGNTVQNQFDINAWLCSLPESKRTNAKAILMKRYQKLIDLSRGESMLVLDKPL
ncbi:MAG: alpha/beta hydrolase [Cyanobacteria bacterium TGS_CYA1]|nr:alpha/beta hydrolase [Cyanobacteria bacterium TGS_CYA1]